MKKKAIILVILFTAVFSNLQAQTASTFRQEGIASWYGREYEGRPTASGEIFDSSQLTAAHPTLPFGTMVVVTNQHNNRRVTVRINDRGPFVAARVIDVSRAAAELLDMVVTGTAPVLVETVNNIYVSPAPAPAPASPAPVNQPQQATVAPDRPPETPVYEIPPSSVITPVNPAPVVVFQPPAVQIPSHITLIPAISIIPEKMYRLQVGSYRIARNAVETFEKLKNAGLNPAYDRHTNEGIEYFRVVLAGVRGIDVQSTAEKIRLAGFSEALIREEN